MSKIDPFEIEVYACVETYLRMRASDPVVAVQIMRQSDFSQNACIAAAAVMGLSRCETLCLCPTYRTSVITIVKEGGVEEQNELLKNMGRFH